MTGDGPDSEILIGRAADGDAAALRRLFERHRARLRRLIAARLDRRLAARLDPSDVVQEALADAGRKLPDYARRRPLPFFPWLRRLALEKCAQARRRALAGRRSPAREEPVGHVRGRALADRIADSATGPSGLCRREEDLRNLRRAFDRLGPADREVLVLRHMEDRSFAEVAVALGITENAAKVRHFRAIGRMRNLMDDRSPG